MTKPDAGLAKEAKAIVALAFRNGPIEDVHAGKVCPVCNGSAEYSRITDDEMKAMMKSAVNAVYKLLWNRDYDSDAYRKSIEYGVRFTSRWDGPE
jgi:sulfatase maturation enzyme AslB (radical SAM superfamily)